MAPLVIVKEHLTLGEFLTGMDMASFLKFAATQGVHLGRPAVKPKVIRRRGEKPFAGVKVDSQHLIPLVKEEVNVLIEAYLMSKRDSIRKFLRSRSKSKR